MLVLSSKTGERVVIGEEIEVVVLEVRGKRVKLGISCPREISIHRRNRIGFEPPELPDLLATQRPVLLQPVA